MSAPETPIACSLDGPSFKSRIDMIATLFRSSLRHARREGASLHLTFVPEARAEVEDLVRLERACCAFLKFDVRGEASGVELTITAPDASSADNLLSGFNEAAVTARSSSCCDG